MRIITYLIVASAAILAIIVAVILSATITMAAHRYHDIQRNAKMTDESVYSLCSAALTDDLFCWCYESHDRQCPSQDTGR